MKEIEMYNCSMPEWRQFIDENPNVIFSLGSGEVWEDGDVVIMADDCEMACDASKEKLTHYFGTPKTEVVL